MRLVVDNIWTFIHGAANFGIIDAVTSYQDPGRFFAQAYKNKHWDGIRRFREYDRSTELYKFPTGLLDRVVEALDVANCAYEIDDQRTLDVAEAVYELPGGMSLRQYQRDAVDLILAKGRGIVKMTTGAGKTAVGGSLIASHNRPTLWLTDRTLLLYQSHRALSDGLQQKVGIIGDENCDIQPVTVSMVQTVIARYHQLHKELAKFEVLILDEAHHASADTWSKIINSVPAPYRYGLTATPVTSGEGLRLVGATGEIAFEIKAKPLIDQGFLVAPEIHWIKTVTPKLPSKAKWATVYKQGIVENKDRNGQIVDLAWKLYLDGIPAVTMVNQISHGHTLMREYERMGINAAFMTSKMPLEKREECLKSLQKNKLNNIIAVTSILGEGVDIAWLSAVINATGSRGGGSQTAGGDGDSGRVTQQMIGRVLRPFPGKTKCFYYDFLDIHHRSLKDASRQRIAALAEAGFEEYFINASVDN